MKTLTLTAYNRPHYLRTTLENLRRNKHEDYALFIGMEPRCQEVETLIDSIDWIRKVVVKNTRRLENKWNLKNIIETAVAHGSTHNVCLEDDVILSPDALDLANWYFNYHCHNYLCLGLFNYYSNPGFPTEVSETKYFAPYGWCFSAEVWKRHIQPNWMCDPRGWDWSFSHLLKRRPELKTLHPKLARSNHIGRENGVHCTPEFYDRTFGNLEISSGDVRTYFVRKLAPSDATFPLVTAVMVTGKDDSRFSLARMAIRSFLEQTYPNKELLIVNHGRESVFMSHPQIREVRITKSKEQTLGDLRNVGLEFARGAFIINWDDDDWYHPLRMEKQVAAQKNQAAVLLKRQIRYSFQYKAGFAMTVQEGIHGTILHPCGVPFRYPSLDRGEDAAFLRNFEEVVVIDNEAPLYIRFHHGNNVWDAAHILGNFAEANMRGKIDLTLEQRGILAQVLANYGPVAIPSSI